MSTRDPALQLSFKLHYMQHGHLKMPELACCGVMKMHGFRGKDLSNFQSRGYGLESCYDTFHLCPTISNPAVSDQIWILSPSLADRDPRIAAYEPAFNLPSDMKVFGSIDSWL